MEGTVDPARPLDGDEIARLLKACDDAERAWVLTGLGTGVRISESSAVRTERIDFFGKQLTVADQARTPSAGPVEARTDEEPEEPHDPAPPSLLKVLARHVERTIPERDGPLVAGGGRSATPRSTRPWRWLIWRCGSSVSRSSVSFHDQRRLDDYLARWGRR